MQKKRRVRLVPSRLATPCWMPLNAFSGALCWPFARPQCKLPDGRTVQESTWLYTQIIGPIPSGKFLHHECLRQSCINPHHLLAVDHKEHGRRHSDLGWARPSRAYSFGLTADPNGKAAA